MSFQDELRTVLEVEREGKDRLEKARDEAERIVEKARDQARLILREGEKTIAREREEEIAATDLEIDKLIAEIRQRGHLEENRLRSLARENRETAVRRILAWLWGET